MTARSPRLSAGIVQVIALLLAAIAAATSAGLWWFVIDGSADSLVLPRTGLLLLLPAHALLNLALVWWTVRAARNARALGHGVRRGGVRSALAWLVPIVNLWMPPVVIRDIARAGGLTTPVGLRAGWLLWIGGATGILTGFWFAPPGTIAALTIAVGAAFQAVAACVLLQVTREISDRQLLAIRTKREEDAARAARQRALAAAA